MISCSQARGDCLPASERERIGAQDGALLFVVMLACCAPAARPASTGGALAGVELWAKESHPRCQGELGARAGGSKARSAHPSRLGQQCGRLRWACSPAQVRSARSMPPAHPAVCVWSCISGSIPGKQRSCPATLLARAQRTASTRRARGLTVSVAGVSRLDWGRNAAALTQGAWWRGTLKPRPAVDWYLDRVDAAMQARATGAVGRRLPPKVLLKELLELQRRVCLPVAPRSNSSGTWTARPSACSRTR